MTLEALATEVRSAAKGSVHVVPSIDRLPDAVADLARPGDLVITLGAGSIGTVGERILEALKARPPQAAALRGERPEPAGNGGRR